MTNTDVCLDKVRDYCENELREVQTDNLYFGKDKGSIYWVAGAETWCYLTIKNIKKKLRSLFMTNNPDDLANQTLSKIKKICKDNLEQFKIDVNLAQQIGLDSSSISKDIIAKKELSQEILNLIKKEVA